MKKVILLTKDVESSTIKDIKNKANKYNINILHTESIDEAKNMETKYIITRNIRDEKLQELTDKIWINDLYLTSVIDNKKMMYEHLEELGIGNLLLKRYLENDIVFPVVIKPTTGSDGTNVFLIESETELKEAIEVFKNHKEDYIIEEFIGDKNTAQDYRLFVLNGNVIMLVERTNENSFISNKAKGGKTKVLENIPEVLYEMSKIIYESVPLNAMTIDFFIDGQVKIIDINASSGIKAIGEAGVDVYEHFFKWYSEIILN